MDDCRDENLMREFAYSSPMNAQSCSHCCSYCNADWFCRLERPNSDCRWQRVELTCRCLRLPGRHRRLLPASTDVELVHVSFDETVEDEDEQARKAIENGEYVGKNERALLVEEEETDEPCDAEENRQGREIAKRISMEQGASGEDDE